jgi:uncharacterized membrane protein
MGIFLKKYAAEIVLGILIMVYAVYFSYFTILRHQRLYSGYFDLGIMNQAVYNTFKGRFLEITNPDGKENFKRMAVHNDVILAIFAPFYYLHPGPETLLVIQSLTVALGALPLFLLAKKQLRSKILALSLSFAYLMYMPLQRSNIFDFHSVTLASSFILFLVYFEDKKQYFFAFIFLILTLATKEQVSLTMSFYAIYLLLNKAKPQKKFAWWVLAISSLWFILSIWIIMPYFRQDQHFALSYYSDFGDKPEKVLFGILLQPKKLFTHLFQADSWLYLFYLLSPLLFIPLASLEVLVIALPEIAINFLSNNAHMRNISLHYTDVIIPFVFLAAIFGLKKILKFKPHLLEKKLAWGLLISTLISAYCFGPLPGAKNQDLYPLLFPRYEVKAFEYWKERLKDERLVISASDYLGAHFTNRRYFYIFSDRYMLSDYVILRIEDLKNHYRQEEQLELYKKLQSDKQFRLIFSQDGLEVYKKVKNSEL